MGKQGALHLVALALFALLTALSWAGQDEPPIQAPPKITFDALQPIGETAEAELWQESFPSAIQTAYPNNNTVKLRITIPKDVRGEMPVVLLLHYWGAADTRIEDDIAGHLARGGIATVEMPLPYHLSRTPPGHVSGDLAIVPSVDAVLGTMRQSISDVVRTVDFIETRPEFNKKEIGIAGTSLGAIVSAACFGVEPRFHSGAFLFGGGDLASIMWNSSKTQLIRASFLRQGWSEERVRRALEPVDPTTLNHPSDMRQTFVVSARFDTVIPAQATAALVSRLGHARKLVVDTGHYGGFLIQAKLGEALERFFNSDFAGVPSDLPPSLNAYTVRLGLLADPDRGFQLAGGIDIWRANRDRDGFASLLLSPKGLSIFLGLDLSNGFAIGASLRPTSATVGAFWSAVF